MLVGKLGQWYNFSMNTNNKSGQYQALSHQEEYAIIKTDLLKVTALNAIYLAVILLLYFTNRHSHYLENWFAKILHF